MGCLQIASTYSTHAPWALNDSQWLQECLELLVPWNSWESFISAAALLGRLEAAPVTNPRMGSTAGRSKISIPSTMSMKPFTPSACIIRPWWIFCKAHKKATLSVVSCLADPSSSYPAGLPSTSLSPVSLRPINLLSGQTMTAHQPVWYQGLEIGQILALSPCEKIRKSAKCGHPSHPFWWQWTTWLICNLTFPNPWEGHHSRNNFLKRSTLTHFVDFQILLELNPFLQTEFGYCLVRHDAIHANFNRNSAVQTKGLLTSRMKSEVYCTVHIPTIAPGDLMKASN